MYFVPTLYINIRFCISYVTMPYDYKISISLLTNLNLQYGSTLVGASTLQHN